jgi:hypothetical protein
LGFRSNPDTPELSLKSGATRQGNQKAAHERRKKIEKRKESRPWGSIRSDKIRIFARSAIQQLPRPAVHLGDVVRIVPP